MDSKEIATYRRMLREIAELAEHCSLTGSLHGGAGPATRRYNACLARLVEGGAVPSGMFEPLDETTTEYGRLGVDARLLASSLEEPERERKRHRGDTHILVRLAPFVDSSDLAKLMREYRVAESDVDEDLLTSLAPFMRREDLSELVDSHLRARTAPHAPHPPHAPTPPVRPTAPVEPVREAVAEPPVPEPKLESSDLDDLIIRLSQPHLTPHERLEIAKRIAGRG